MHFANETPASPPGPTDPTLTPANDRQQKQEDNFDIFLYLRILLMNWWIILPLTLAGAGAGYFLWMRTPPVYRATCQLEILSNTKLGQDRDLVTQTYGRGFLNRQLLLLESPKLNDMVEAKLKAKWSDKEPPGARPLEVTIRPVRGAANAMLNIYVDSFNPDYSLEYLQELLAGYEEMRYDEAAFISESTLRNLQDELKNYSVELEEAENEILRFESEHDLMFEEKRNKSHQTLLASMLSQQAKIAAQRQMLERQFPFLEDSNAATLQEVLVLSLPSTTGNAFSTDPDSSSITINSSTAVTDMEGDQNLTRWRENEAKVIRLEAEYQTLLKTYKPTHPKMLDLRREIESAERDLTIAAELTMKRLVARRDALKMQEEALASAAQELKKSYVPNTGSQAQYERLLERAARLAKRQDQVFTTIVDMTSAAVDRTMVHLLQEPALEEYPIWPVRWKIMLVTTAAGAAGSMVLVLVIFFIKSRLYNFARLEEHIGIKCLAGVQKLSLGRLKRSKKVPIVVTRERDSLVSETFRNLRTSVENALPEGATTLMISSPEPSEGKSLLGLNTAVVFSWNHSKVLIIDGDFRKRWMSKAFPGTKSNNGLVDLLADSELNLKDCIVKAPIADVAPNLDYLPAGHKRDDTAELLTMPRLREILNEIGEEYDFVVIDTAPVNRVVDSILFAKQVDAVLLVARSGKTTVPALRYCCSRIGLQNVIGYVINGIDRSNSRYSYYASGYYQGRYYYNGYSYKGYYGDSTED